MRKFKHAKPLLSLILTTILFLSLLPVSTIASALGSAAPTDLKIELMNSPLLLENLTGPAFSWVMNSDKRGTLQSAYQINVYDEAGGIYWNSGKVMSSKSSAVKYTGNPLVAGSLYTWTVKTWDDVNTESPWAQKASFMTALKDGWQATTSPIWASGTNNWAFFRKEFTVSDKPVKRVMLYATGYNPSFGRQNIYRLNLNGEFVGVGPARRYSTVTSNTYNTDIFYNAYDITDRIAKGSTNAVGVICCSGTSRAFLAEIHIQYTDGETVVIGTDTSWRAFSNNTVFGTNRYHNSSHQSWVGHTGYNEYIRGDLYPFDFDKVGFNDTSWANSVTNTNINKTRLVGYNAENMVEEIVQPVKITKHSNGNWVVDYGEMVWGGFILNINPNDATWDGSTKYVDIREGEVLYGTGTPGTTTANTGTVKYQAAMGCNFNDRFYLVNRQQTMRMWGTHTFRYAEFIGLPTFVNADNFTDYVQTYRLIYPSDFSVSSFDSSNKMLNEIYEFCKRSIELLNCDLYMDSPNRERLPYEADSYIQMLANYATNNDFAAPRLNAEHALLNPTWPMEWKIYAIMMMYEDYLNTGDNSLLVKYYTNIKNAVPAPLNSGFNITTGIVTKTPGSASSSNADIFDWPSSYRTDISMTNQNVITNSFYYEAQKTLNKIALAVGNSTDADSYANTAAISRAAIQNGFFDTAQNAFKDSLTGPSSGKTNFTMQGNLFPAAWGVANEEQSKAAAAHMASYGELKGNVYSSAFGLPVMFRYGQGPVAVQYITGQDANGNNTSSIRNWRHMIELGSGSTMEAFDESHDSTVSHSHPWGASPASIIPNETMGILPLSPAFEAFQIKPVDAGLAYASVSRPTIRGQIEVSYKYEGFKYKLDASIPCNTTAMVYLPAMTDKAVYESGVLIPEGKTTNGVTFVGYEDGGDTVVLEVGSGTYSFLTTNKVLADIRADEANVIVNNPASYTVSLNNTKGVGIVELSFTFDGYVLDKDSITVTPLNGFTSGIYSPVPTWQYMGQGMWKGTVKYMYLADKFVSIDGPLDILKINGTALGTSPATVTLTDFSVSGDNGINIGSIPSKIRTAEAAVAVGSKPAVYSKYDLNKDGSIDETDLLYLVYFYQWNDRDAGWDTVDLYGIFAKDCDFQINGKVDLADMIELTANYGIYDPYA